MSPDLPPLALIAGPTASGKSDLAVRLAQALGAKGKRAVVINADSAQVYRDLKVVSARPTEEDMGGVEHRLYGTWDGAVACSAADWATAAKREIRDLHADGAVPILCGGTGLYMRVLLEGIAPVPTINSDIRETVRAMDIVELHHALSDEDPDAADRIHHQDTTRMQRALEVVRSTGTPLARWQERKVGGIATQVDVHAAVLLPDREWLYDRCNRRFDWMLEHGAIDEVEALHARNIDPALPVMRAIGVPEIATYLTEVSPDMSALRSAGQQATRNYAKRQYTWFRNQSPRGWPRVAQSEDGLLTFYDLIARTGDQ